MLMVIVLLIYLYILFQKQNMVIDPEPNEVDKVEAICDLIYDYLQTHFSSFDTYSF